MLIEERMRSRKTRKLRSLFYAISAVLYGAAFILFLEVFALMADKRLERINPLVVAHKCQAPIFWSTCDERLSCFKLSWLWTSG